MEDLKIAGLQPTSLIDYPDQIAAVIFTAGCNLRCPYCHNPELIEFDQPGYYEVKEILDLLKERRDFLDGLAVTGGEPLLQPGLKEFLQQVKELGYLVKLDTNGLQPDKLAELISADLLDMVAWDYKLPALDYRCLGYQADADQPLAETGRILQQAKAEGKLEVEVRTTAVPTLVDAEIISKIAQAVGQYDFRYVIQNFRNEQVLDPDFSEIKSFNRQTLQDFKAIAEKYIDEVEIRENH